MPGALILCYHRVVTAPPVDPFGRGIQVTAARFRQHMEILARRFTIVALDDLVTRLVAGGRAEDLAAVTFDDGYVDNRANALPVLADLGVPATIFLVTQYVEQQRPFWTDRLDAYLRAQSGKVVTLPAGLGVRADLTSAASAHRVYRDLHARLRVLDDGTERDAWMDRLGARADMVESRPLSWDDVQDMQHRGVAFGAHTLTHPSLPGISEKARRTEIEGSKTAVADHVQRPSIAFAYPFGHTDEHVCAAAEAAGFRAGLTIDPGPCGAGHTPFVLPRLVVSDWTAQEFGYALDRFGTPLQRLRSGARALKARIPPGVAAAVRKIAPRRRNAT